VLVFVSRIKKGAIIKLQEHYWFINNAVA